MPPNRASAFRSSAWDSDIPIRLVFPAIALILLLPLSFSGCVTTSVTFADTDPASVVLKLGSDFLFTTPSAGKKENSIDGHTIPDLRRRDDAFVLTVDRLPGISLYGIFERRHPDTIKLYLTGAYLFSNWANGWTEGYTEASGVLVLRRTAAGLWKVETEDPIELWTVQFGEIRYYDTYLRGDEGLSKVKARIDRITALAELIAEVFPDNSDEPATPRLLEDLRAIIDPPIWLPELLDSGTIERDLREAGTLLTAFYNLELLQDSILNEVLLMEM